MAYDNGENNDIILDCALNLTIARIFNVENCKVRLATRSDRTTSK